MIEAPVRSGMEEVLGRSIPQLDFSLKLLRNPLVQHGVNHLDEARDMGPVVER